MLSLPSRQTREAGARVNAPSCTSCQHCCWPVRVPTRPAIVCRPGAERGTLSPARLILSGGAGFWSRSTFPSRARWMFRPSRVLRFLVPGVILRVAQPPPCGGDALSRRIAQPPPCSGDARPRADRRLSFVASAAAEPSHDRRGERVAQMDTRSNWECVCPTAKGVIPDATQSRSGIAAYPGMTAVDGEQEGGATGRFLHREAPARRLYCARTQPNWAASAPTDPASPRRRSSRSACASRGRRSSR